MNGTAKEKLGNTSTVRATPSRYGRDTGRRIYPYSTIEFTEIVPVVVSGISDNPDDKWLKLPDGNYVNYILSAREYYTILTYPPTDPTPTPGNDKIEIYVNGVLTYSITGTIDVP